MKIIIASKNLHKIREIKSILKSQFTNIDFLSLLDFPDYKPSKESGKSFKENAIIKAQEAAKQFNIWALSEDSGLIIPALNGKPGIYSARFAGEDACSKDNRKKLLLDMKHLKNDDRNAYFECWVVLSSPSGKVEKCSNGICEGRIIDQEKGGDGFGYDPLFIKNEYNKTFAELKEEIKNKISHRRKALDKMINFLDSLVHI